MVSAYEKAIKSLWKGRCDIYVQQLVINPSNQRNERKEVLFKENEPCRLSFTTIPTTQETDTAALLRQGVKLFISKDIDVPPGSKIVVRQEGKTTTYVKSGEPAVYSYHQEINLELFKEYA